MGFFNWQFIYGSSSEPHGAKLGVTSFSEPGFPSSPSLCAVMPVEAAENLEWLTFVAPVRVTFYTYTTNVSVSLLNLAQECNQHSSVVSVASVCACSVMWLIYQSPFYFRPWWPSSFSFFFLLRARPVVSLGQSDRVYYWFYDLNPSDLVSVNSIRSLSWAVHSSHSVDIDTTPCWMPFVLYIAQC